MHVCLVITKWTLLLSVCGHCKTLSAEPFFACPILVYLRKTFHESSRRIFVERALHYRLDLYSFESGPNSPVLCIVGSVMVIGLSINGCSRSKNIFTGENKIN